MDGTHCFIEAIARTITVGCFMDRIRTEVATLSSGMVGFKDYMKA